MIYFSTFKNGIIEGFYSDKDFPNKEDSWGEITEEYHQKCVDGMNNGKVLRAKNGNILIEDYVPTQEVLDKRAIKEMTQYLYDTDWYVIRKQENGKDIPEEILAKREDYRNKIK